mmetsp:Transcript_1882/g.3913  ORF Transcript_1882/g.3913 Transcript_1882/m.3913 type:complete len:202 (-) Transcript_1882:131-736(-)
MRFGGGGTSASASEHVDSCSWVSVFLGNGRMLCEEACQVPMRTNSSCGPRSLLEKTQPVKVSTNTSSSPTSFPITSWGPSKHNSTFRCSVLGCRISCLLGPLSSSSSWCWSCCCFNFRFSSRSFFAFLASFRFSLRVIPAVSWCVRVCLCFFGGLAASPCSARAASILFCLLLIVRNLILSNTDLCTRYGFSERIRRGCRS